MKPGDLVQIRGDSKVGKGGMHWLYGGDDRCWDERGALNPTDIPFGLGDLGLVLKKRKMVPGRYTQSYVKILTPKGIGWVFEEWIELAK